MMLVRTVKSCGSDAPIVGVKPVRRSAGDGVKKRGHRGEREVSRKTIARGMPGRSGVTVVTMLVCFFHCMRGFCNGPRRVNPFLRHPLAGHLLLSGIGAGPSPDGVHERTGRPICGKRDRIVGCVDNSHDGLAWSIVPAKGLRFGESLVWGPARNPVCPPCC